MTCYDPTPVSLVSFLPKAKHERAAKDIEDAVDKDVKAGSHASDRRIKKVHVHISIKAIKVDQQVMLNDLVSNFDIATTAC